MSLRMMGVLLPLFLTACATTPRSNYPDPDTSAIPSYQKVVQGYNRHIERLDRMWCRANVEVRWRDARGGREYEQGEASTLMMVPPHRMALSVAKAIKSAMWLGCDDRRYWLFDLMDRPIAYVGFHDRFHQNAARDLPIKIRPVDLPRLLGVVPIDPDILPPAPAVSRFQGAYVIEPPGTWSRLRIDQRTYLPVAVELLDENRRAVVIAKLSKPGRVELHNLAPGGWPTIMTRIEIRMAESEDWIRLHLSSMTDARARIHKRKAAALEHAFNFEKLLTAHTVERVIDLDRRRSP